MDIKTALEKRNISQTEAAKMVGVHKQYLNRVVNGTPVGRKMAKRLRGHFPEVDLESLLYPNNKTD